MKIRIANKEKTYLYIPNIIIIILNNICKQIRK